MIKNIALFIMFVLLCAAAWWIFNNPPKLESPIERATKETANIEVGQLSRSVNEKGEEAVTADVTKHVLSQAGLESATDSAGIIDSVLRLLHSERGSKRRILESYTQARAQIKRYEAIMSETDTSFTYKDDWLTVDVKKPLGNRPPLLNHTYDMELNLMWYNERKWLLAKRRTYGRFWPNDPNATIMGLKHFRVEPPVKRFGLTVMAVGEYYGGEALIGGGVSVDIGRFRVQGNYLYDGEQWQPAIRGGFKLVDW